ncbi:unnamed protein product [Prunus armeniaca]|uniref:Aminotransferase-like plant mobile domain-containing protein n=1 Tax=Prunus armeniaca TaxID=36596 RepID=A0A6J5TJL5_PRUAR|nr:unnamed protein product [Prunus armeniaca]
MPTNKAIRPECFYMASLMARELKVALGTVAIHLRGLGLPNACLPIHYVLGWLGEHFPDLTTRRCDSNFPEYYPVLKRHSQIDAKYVDLTRARIIFKSDSVVYHPNVFLAQEDYILSDTENLADDTFEYLICMHSALLAERLARAQVILLHKDTTTRFYIPRFTSMGSALGGTGKRGFNSSSPPLVASSRRGHKKRIRNARGQHFSGVNHLMHQSQRVNQDSHLKWARHENHNMVEVGSSSHVLDEESSNPVQGEMRFDDISFPLEMKPINADNPTFEFISSDSWEWSEQSRWEFISGEIEGIFSRFSSSKTPAQFHMHHSEIIKALRLLRSTVDILGCGETTFKQFAQLVDWIFELARRRSKSSAYIEALGDVNVDVIHDLISQHEECLNIKLALETKLTEVAKEIEDLDVKEATIREAEERVLQMREEHEAKKTSLNMQKMNLEISLEHQNEQATQLQESRTNAKEELLP